jgi:dihydroxy-acid dehydratase
MITLNVSDEELAQRRHEQERRAKPFTPTDRVRPVSAALRAYASMATSASDGAYRLVPE